MSDYQTTMLSFSVCLSNCTLFAYLIYVSKAHSWTAWILFAWFIYKLWAIRQSFFPLIQYIGSSNQTTLGWHVDSPGRNTLGMSALQNNISHYWPFWSTRMPVMFSSCYLTNEEVRECCVNTKEFTLTSCTFLP